MSDKSLVIDVLSELITDLLLRRLDSLRTTIKICLQKRKNASSLHTHWPVFGVVHPTSHQPPKVFVFSDWDGEFELFPLLIAGLICHSYSTEIHYTSIDPR